MNTFNYFKHLRKSALKTLIDAGIKTREAYSLIRGNMPYLFISKSECDKLDEKY